MEWKVLYEQENEGRPNKIEEEDKIERSSVVQERIFKTQLNDKCVRNRLESDAGGNSKSTGANLCVGDMEWNSKYQIFQLKRIECCSDESKTFHQDYSGRKVSMHQNKQRSDRILSLEVDNKKKDVSIIEESEKINNTIRNQNLNGTYSGNSELNNRQLEQGGNKRGLLIGSTNTVESVPKASDIPNDRWLHESNQQVTKKILQLVTGQQRRRTGCVQSELEQRMLLVAPSNQNDIENSQKNCGGQNNSISNTIQLEMTNLERVIEAVNSERDEIGQSGDNSESGSSNDSESIETVSKRAARRKDDRHEPGE
ncbi:MAG: hypothetical protein EZS28_023781 [Streblomastix strix]|uniref:Uncharacterized protein n=1 Tax=Streblomastix strix TaxID=222440 RepID=A0A5J4VDZ9_9EUKA|nr:MAG: hypothetical protein EZS28_023781 [Streblomastix strix]